MPCGRYNGEVDIPSMFAISRSLGLPLCPTAARRGDFPKGVVKRFTDE
jgi:hypothetical protein